MPRQPVAVSCYCESLNPVVGLRSSKMAVNWQKVPRFFVGGGQNAICYVCSPLLDGAAFWWVLVKAAIVFSVTKMGS